MGLWLVQGGDQFDDISELNRLDSLDDVANYDYG
jgi:hypothetical protein